MTTNTANDRATMPAGTNKILDRRTLQEGNENLLKLLNSGLSVLDVGCGSGSITSGIAEKVGPTGKVLGIDTSEHLIDLARQNFATITNLRFEVADIGAFEPAERFDLVTSARVLQWLANPREVLQQMKHLLKAGGWIAILDYNHEKIAWTPAPPVAMQKFYTAFLQWRKDAGFDNAIADNLKDLLLSLGFVALQVEKQFEITRKEDLTFQAKARIWSEVAELRGPQLVKAQYLTEEERLAAIKDYDDWIANTGQSLQLYLLAVSGRVGE